MRPTTRGATKPSWRDDLKWYLLLTLDLMVLILWVGIAAFA